ncbi:MAG: hypothetical protein V1806_08285, partial [Pseudomonadota bacterium]
MAFSSWRLPKIIFGKLPKPAPIAIGPGFERAIHGPPMETPLAVVCRRKPSMAFSSGRLPKIIFGKLPKPAPIAIGPGFERA